MSLDSTAMKKAQYIFATGSVVTLLHGAGPGVQSQVDKAREKTTQDRFGVVQLYPTIDGGREWFASWESKRTVSPYTFDKQEPLMRNEDGVLKIDSGIAAVRAGMTRLVITTPKDSEGRITAPLWRNVEMTIYARYGATKGELDYRALYLSARSGEQHNDKVPCEGTSYHATARFDGQFGFKKELWHTGGYTKLRSAAASKLWPTIPKDRWIGLKFVCRNRDKDSRVDLSLYLDQTANNDWKLVAHTIDEGDWSGESAGCGRPINAVIAEAGPAVYFRTDDVDVELKKFSVREISPLP
jgi:hypothetical protein